MKSSTTLILLLMTALLAGFIVFFESRMPTSEEAEYSQLKFMDIKAENIKLLTLAGKPAESMTGETSSPALQRVIWKAEKKDDSWEMTEPVRDLCDYSLVNSILSTLESVRAYRIIEGSYDDYGLNPPDMVLGLVDSQGLKHEVFMGDRDPLGRGVYCSRSGMAGKIWLIPRSLADMVTNNSDDMRNREIVPVGCGDITEISLKSGDISYCLVRKDNLWFLEKPFRDYGDTQIINHLLGRIERGRILNFNSAIQPSAKQSPDSRKLEMELTHISGSKSKLTFIGDSSLSTMCSVTYSPFLQTGTSEGVICTGQSNIGVDEFPFNPEAWLSTHPVITFIEDIESLKFEYPSGESVEFMIHEKEGLAVRGHCDRVPAMEILTPFWRKLSALSVSELLPMDQKGAVTWSDTLLRVTHVSGKFTETIEFTAPQGLSELIYCKSSGRDRIMAVSGDIAVNMPNFASLTLPVICKMSRNDITEISVSGVTTTTKINQVDGKWVSGDQNCKVVEANMRDFAASLEFLSPVSMLDFSESENGEEVSRVDFEVTGRMEIDNFRITHVTRRFALLRNGEGNHFLKFNDKYYSVADETVKALSKPLVQR